MSVTTTLLLLYNDKYHPPQFKEMLKTFGMEIDDETFEEECKILLHFIHQTTLLMSSLPVDRPSKDDLKLIKKFH